MTLQPAAALLAALTLTASLNLHADTLLPWRKVTILFSPKTRLFVEGVDKKRYEIRGGARQHFLDDEKGGPVVNVCKGRVSGDQLSLRCDRKGGLRGSAKPIPWWWRYKAKIEGDNVIIDAVSQKDGVFESGEEIEAHFRGEIDYAF
ncbi:hypothetical protein KFZ76_01900 [Methylovulum psychrotolerans]|uniref:hypothetical protein n=1 Tax=Methylovulum psychrotolerans TaxID=1704499 RepID=UPI001BFF9C03|nr:hypothetical protein [Methylovulum psychrotolerans]MBT9096461.1 hypothetical protein [Methylovulum psychrotolerans]